MYKYLCNLTPEARRQLGHPAIMPYPHSLEVDAKDENEAAEKASTLFVPITDTQAARLDISFSVPQARPLWFVCDLNG